MGRSRGRARRAGGEEAQSPLRHWPGAEEGAQVRIRTQARLREEPGSRLKSVDGSVVGRFSKSAEEGPAGCVLTW